MNTTYNTGKTNIFFIFQFLDEDDLIDDDLSEDRNVDVEDSDSDDSDKGNLMIDDTRGTSM